MTVTKGRKQAYVYPDSNNTSDSESLHLPSTSNSDVESESNFETRLANGGCLPILKDFCYIRKNAGRRKQRRFNNRSELQVLDEEEESEYHIKLMEDYKSPFARVLENEDNLQQWNDFINLSEEKQKAMLDLGPSTIQFCVKNKPAPKISSRIKRAMKVKKNLSMEMVEKMENEVVNYFKHSPQGVFLASPPTSFERLLVHAIAQYHHLKSMSVIKIKRFVEVTCSTADTWKPMEESFCNFVKQLS